MLYDNGQVDFQLDEPETQDTFVRPLSRPRSRRSRKRKEEKAKLTRHAQSQPETMLVAIHE